MRKITYFESMRGKLNQVSREELYAFRAYEECRKLNLTMPIVTESILGGIGGIARTFTKAGIGKFIYAIPSTNSTDDIAELYLAGYKIVDILGMENLLGAYSYITCCKLGLVFGRK